MANLTKPTSINRIYNELKSQGVSIGKNTLYDLIEQTEAIYLFFSLTRYTTSLVKESSSDKKYYAIDTGLRNILLNPQSEDNGKLLENVVFLYLRRTLSLQENIYYYKEKKECDFLICDQLQVTKLVQVSWSIHDEVTRKREVEGLLEAAHATACTDLLIVTFEEEGEIIEEGQIINIPAWKYMLGAV